MARTVNLLDLLETTVSGLEDCVQQLAAAFERPILTSEPTGYPVFRHRARSDVLASFLKAVRIASALHASLALLRVGHVQEVWILCRCIDEASEEIYFLAIDSPEAEKRQRRFLDEFFQEELDSSAKEKLVSTKRHRVPRKKIQALLAKLPVPFSNPSDRQRAQDVLHKAYSGYVHGAYPHIMELYGDSPGFYHTSGMRGTPFEDLCQHDFVNYLYRALLAVEVVAARCGRKSVQADLINLAVDLARKTGCVDDTEIRLALGRLDRSD